MGTVKAKSDITMPLKSGKQSDFEPLFPYSDNQSCMKIKTVSDIDQKFCLHIFPGGESV